MHHLFFIFFSFWLDPKAIDVKLILRSNFLDTEEIRYFLICERKSYKKLLLFFSSVLRLQDVTLFFYYPQNKLTPSFEFTVHRDFFFAFSETDSVSYHLELLPGSLPIWLDIQQGTNIPERLLNKPYVNDVTLRGQKSPLKCC